MKLPNLYRKIDGEEMQENERYLSMKSIKDNTYNIHYNEEVMVFERVEDVINAVNTIRKRQHQEQVFLTISMKTQCISVAFIEGNQCSLLVTPEDSREDSIITYNKEMNPDGDYVKINDKAKGKFSFTKYHLIPEKLAMEELRCILEGKKLNLNWHAY